MMNNAYLQQPNLHHQSLVFTTDDDLWMVPLQGGQARRLTTSKGLSHSPFFSPDGRQIAYLSNDHGQSDLYLIPAAGGPPQRLTYCGVGHLSGWKDSRTLIYSSNRNTFHPRATEIYEINLKTLESKLLPCGHANYLRYGEENHATPLKTKKKRKSVLGRNIGDPARWKHYRGGTAGTLWVDREGKAQFKPILKKLNSNLSNPLWIKGRIYFISDHQGVGNIYSCDGRGAHLRQHSFCREYYVRSFSHHQNLIVYQSGARIFQLDLSSGSEKKIPIQVDGSFNQALPRYESSLEYLQNFSLTPDGHQLALISRGQLFTFKPWGGAPFKLGNPKLRYRQSCYVQNKSEKTFLMTIELDHQNEERLKLFELKNFKSQILSSRTNLGKIYQIYPSPKGGHVAITNNRSELWLLNLATKKLKKIDRDPHCFFGKISWSPCGHYLAYACSLTKTKKEILLYCLQTHKKKALTQPVLSDSQPVFDPSGQYLFFIGIREFHPSYCETHFELGFPLATRPYALVLSKKTPDPYDTFLGFDEGEESEGKKNQNKAKGKKQIPSNSKTKIDWEGIENRVVSLPLPLGGYQDIAAVKDKIFFLRQKLQVFNPYAGPENGEDKSLPELYSYDFKKKKEELFCSDILSAKLCLTGKYWTLLTPRGLRICSTENRPHEESESNGEEYSKKNGWVNLNKVKVHLDPKNEWKQMYQEAWILQREHFWNPKMSQVDWKKVYDRYLPLLPKVHTRREFSDLIWEMQGELRTSHCYEFDGDYHRRPPYHPVAGLAAQLKWNAQKKAMIIEEIAQGDNWIAAASSPLSAPNVSLNSGDMILGIDGVPLEDCQSLPRALEGRAYEKVNLLIQRKKQSRSPYQKEQISVRALPHNNFPQYRHWVEKNKKYVHQKSKNKLGYLHIPDMSIRGYSEFYRHFLAEYHHQGLVVDVRYNGGGNISQHLLKVLAQRIVGFDYTRYWGKETYPAYGVNGPLVCLTNEHAGSDGDIFSHTFKLMKLGKLVGKRTWGGVIGIWPRLELNDGTWTSQPEFSFWFKDVGWQVENYGTEPDIEVDITPKDWAGGKDPQLDKAIEVLLKDLKTTPPLNPKES